MSNTPNPFGDSLSMQPSEPSVDRFGPSTTGKLKGSTKTFAIVLLVLGLLGVSSAIAAPILILVARTALNASDEAGADLPNRKLAQAQIDQALSPMSIASLVVSFVVGLGLTIGGIGTLMRRRPAAQLLRWSAALMVPLTFVQSATGLYLQATNKDAVMQQIEEQMNQSGQGQPPPGFDTMMDGIFLVQLAFGACLGLVFVAVYLWAFLHFSKPSTMDQFPRDGAQAPAM